MASTKLVLSLAVVSLIGCTDGGMTGDDGGGGDTRPGMTNGVSTLAGWANPGYLDGNRQVNLFSNPTNVAIGPDGKLYVADFDNSKLRVVDMEGNASTVVSTANFQRPFGLVFVGNTLYASTDNDSTGQHDPIDSTTQMSGAIWRIDIAGKSATLVADKIGRPRGLCALADGRIGVADYAHHVIEIVDPTGTVTTLAGTWNAPGQADGAGVAASFNQPYACAQRPDGKLVVTDWANHKLRSVALDGTVTTLAGTTAGFADGGLAGAKFNHPQGLTVTKSGDLYVTDIDNYRVRKISSDLSTVSTVAGDGTGGYKDDDDKTASELYGLEGLSVKPDGTQLFVADGNRGESVQFNRIRMVKL